MALLIIASETFGLVGVIAVVPAASIARDSFKYFYEQWSEERPLETIADTELQQTTSSEI
jgi:predicted PurR-regulated permease PerM